MSTLDFNTMQGEVKERLAYLNSVYLYSVSEPVFGGGANNMDILNLNDTGASRNTFDTFNFTGVTNPRVSAFNNGVYSDLIGIFDINNNIQTTTSEINCLPLLFAEDTTINTTNPNNNTINRLEGLYTLYAILNADYFDLFVSNTKENNPQISPLNIPSYDIETKAIKLINVSAFIPKYLAYISSTLVENIVNTPKFNAFIARRIVYFWILTYQYSIAYNYYLQNSSNVDAKNLALKCLELLQNNNSSFDYKSAMTNSVQDSNNAQAFHLLYQMWCIVVQTLIPPALGSLDITTGTISIAKPTDKCTHIDPSLAISTKVLEQNYKALVAGYDGLTDASAKEFISEIQKSINNITKPIACSNSLTVDPELAKTTAAQNLATLTTTNANNLVAKGTTVQAAITAKTDADNKYKILQSKATALNTAKNNLQNAQQQLNSANAQYRTQSSQQTTNTANFPQAQNLVNATGVEISTPRQFTTVPANVNYNSAPSYTVAFDIKIAQTNPNFRCVMINGPSDSDRRPAFYITGTTAGKPGNRIHVVHDTRNPTNFGLTGNKVLAPGTTNTVTITVYNNTLSLFINGVLDVSVSATPTNPLVWTTNTNWRWNQPGYANSGSVFVNNANWWNVPLTNTQISTYNSNKSVATAAAGIQSSIDTTNATITKLTTDTGVNGSLTLAYNNALTENNNALTAYNVSNAAYTAANKASSAAIIAAASSSQLLATATTIWKSLSNTPNTSILITDLQSLTTRFLNITADYKNRQTIDRDDIINDSLYDFKSSISKNITTYRDKQSEINSIAPTLDKNKETLKNTQMQLQSRKTQGSTLKKYEYIALTILILITIFAFVIIIMPLEKSMKLILTTLLTVIVIVNAHVLQIVFNRSGLMEKFGGSLQQRNQDITVANMNYLDAASEYLSETENLNIILESNTVYNNATESLTKELTYFQDASEQLVNSNDKVHSVYKSSYITQIEYSASIQLFKTLSIVVAGFTISYVALESLDITGSAYMWITLIAALIIAIAVIIYMLEVNSRVRTNPKQIYWGNEPAKSF